MTETAIVILNFNGEKLLRQFLPTVIVHSGDAKVYVADNGSTDDSVNILKKDFPTVSLIELGSNFGFCGGYNRALKLISAAYYVIINSDVEVTPNWLKPIIARLTSDPTVAAAQPKILSFRQKNKFEYAGAGGGFLDAMGYPFCRGRLFNFTEEDRGQYNDSREIFWASGACLIIRASTFHRFGGFDEDYFAHMEEIDLCWKIQRTNDKVIYYGESTVFHLGAGTLGYENPRKTFLNFRNGLAIVFKHFGTGELFYKLPLRILLDWSASILFLLRGQLANSGAVFKAHLAFAASLGSNFRKRKALRKEFPSYTKRNIYNGLVVVEHFLKRRNRIDI